MGDLLVRYTASGALDPSFGTGGKLTTPIGSSDDSGQSVAVQGDGKILVAGASDNGSNFEIALVRYTVSGALDPDFGTGGKVTTDFGGSSGVGSSLALQSDGKIVVAGYSDVGGSSDIAVVRYEGGSVAPPMTMRIGRPESSTFTLTLTGWPNATNRIEFADKLLSPTDTVWQPLAAVKLDGQGIGAFTDLSLAHMRFYRAVYP